MMVRKTVDVWSLGVILYTLVSGSLPFDGQNLKELRERVLRGNFRIPFYVSTDCGNLLKKFLILNPTRRPTLDLETMEASLAMNPPNVSGIGGVNSARPGSALGSLGGADPSQMARSMSHNPHGQSSAKRGPQIQAAQQSGGGTSNDSHQINGVTHSSGHSGQPKEMLLM